MAELLTLARPYARAAFDVAKTDKTIALWADTLAILEAVVADPKVAALLQSPSLTSDAKQKALLSLMDKPAATDSKIANFLSVLAENKRLNLLGAIKTLFFELKAQLEKAVEVEVSTAYEISEPVKQALVAALTKKLEREVSLSTSVDPSLLGGALIRAGDTVIDGSVKGRLAKLAEAMNS